MADPKGKSPKQILFESMNALQESVSKYSDMNKETKAAQKLLEKIGKLKEKVDKYSKAADVPFLSDTTKTHLSDIYTRVKYQRIEDVKTKYIEKGLLMEEEAITVYSLFTGEFHEKNKERRYNAWIEGEADILKEDTVIDTKVNWSIFQFNRVISRPIKPLYHWQLEGYMWLYDKPKARLAYCLVNTPEHLICLEEKKLLYDFVGTEDDYKDACADLRRNHIYDDIPLEDKIRFFDIKRDDERIDRIKSRVEECRIYLNNIDKHEIFEENESEDDG